MIKNAIGRTDNPAIPFSSQKEDTLVLSNSSLRLGTTVTETFGHATFVMVTIVPIQNAFYSQTTGPGVDLIKSSEGSTKLVAHTFHT